MFSPVYHLEGGPDRRSGQTPDAASARFPSMFIARAGLDDANLNEGLDRFVQVALKKNVAVELVNHVSGHHGFDIEDDNERSREILKRTIEFIKTQTAK